MPDSAALSALSNDEVVDAVLTWAGRIAAGEARLSAYIGELDQREAAWSGPGLLSCAHFLSWKLGLSLTTAHEKVRVARALRQLPLTATEFSAGRLSFSQVRAITRVATPETEATYVECARHATGAQLDRLVRGVRRAKRHCADAADPDQAAYRMRTSVRYDEDGTLVLTVRLPAEEGAVVLAALEAARTQLDAAGAPPDRADLSGARRDACGESASAEDDGVSLVRPAARASMRDGLLALAHGYLEQRASSQPAAARRDRADLAVCLDPLSGWGRLPDGELLPPPVTAALLTRYDQGRQSREPGPPLRDLLRTVDGARCRFPGCTRRRKLHAHHVVFWAAGGRTDLANLILVCSRHHTLIHTRGYELTLAPATRRLTVTAPGGVLIPHHPEQPFAPAEQLDPTGAVDPTVLSPNAYDPLDLHYAVAVLLQQAA